MVIQDRFWRLVFLFWWFSAAALVLGMVSKPLLRSVVVDSAIPPMTIVAPAESSSTRNVIVPPAAFPRSAEHVADAPSRAHHIHRSEVRSGEIALVESKRTTSTTHRDSPRTAIATADAPSPPVAPPIEAPKLVQAKTVGTLPMIEATANQLGDQVASSQKWLVDEAGITVHGLLDFGTNYNFNQPATGNNLYRVFDYFGASSFEPNQAELYVSRSMPNQPGFVVDLNFLNTAEVMHGLTSYYGDQPGAHNPTGWMDPTQVYLTLLDTGRKWHQFDRGPPGEPYRLRIHSFVEQYQLQSIDRSPRRTSARSPRLSAMPSRSSAPSQRGSSIGMTSQVSILSPTRDPSLLSYAPRGDASRPRIRTPARTRLRPR
jgi:hypothetical protein